LDVCLIILAVFKQRQIVVTREIIKNEIIKSQ
jgi:hypothetical protein